MKTKLITWTEMNIDLECDGEPVLIEQEWGNKGLGGIVFGLCSLGVGLPFGFTIKQIAFGTATGNPVGALIALFFFFAWPLYWGLNQFFLVRRLQIIDTEIQFEMVSLIGTQKYSVKIQDEYDRLESGRTSSISRSEGVAGQTGKYYLRLPHTDRQREVILYENVGQPISPERIEQYVQRFQLPHLDRLQVISKT